MFWNSLLSVIHFWTSLPLKVQMPEGFLRQVGVGGMLKLGIDQHIRSTMHSLWLILYQDIIFALWQYLFLEAHSFPLLGSGNCLHHRTGNFSKYLHTCIFSWEIGVNQCSCHLTMKILCIESSESSRLPLQYAWLIQQIFTHLFLGHNSSSYLSNMLTQSQEQSSM